MDAKKSDAELIEAYRAAECKNRAAGEAFQDARAALREQMLKPLERKLRRMAKEVVTEAGFLLGEAGEAFVETLYVCETVHAKEPLVTVRFELVVRVCRFGREVDVKVAGGWSKLDEHMVMLRAGVMGVVAEFLRTAKDASDRG